LKTCSLSHTGINLLYNKRTYLLSNFMQKFWRRWPLKMRIQAAFWLILMILYSIQIYNWVKVSEPFNKSLGSLYNAIFHIPDQWKCEDFNCVLLLLLLAFLPFELRFSLRRHLRL